MDRRGGDPQTSFPNTRVLVTNSAGSISAPLGHFNSKYDSDSPHWQIAVLTEGDGRRLLLQTGVAVPQDITLGAFPKLESASPTLLLTGKGKTGRKKKKRKENSSF